MDTEGVGSFVKSIFQRLLVASIPLAFLFKRDRSLFLLCRFPDIAAAECYRDPGTFYLIVPPSSNTLLSLMVQDSCSSTNLHFCITSSRKEEKGTGEVALFAFKVTTQELVTSFLFILCCLCSTLDPEEISC